MTGGRRPLRVVAALLLAASCGAGARAQEGVVGTWRGTYECAQGLTGLSLHISPDAGGLRALFHFYAVPANPGVPEGCYEMSGRYDPATRQLDLIGGRWLKWPLFYVAVDVSGALAADGAELRGQIVSPLCTVFVVRRTTPSPEPAPQACRPAGAAVSALE